MVGQRIEVLRERRFAGRQTFGEFMIRRYDPAMRPRNSTALRLSRLADRPLLTGPPVRTRADEGRAAQPPALVHVPA